MNFLKEAKKVEGLFCGLCEEQIVKSDLDKNGEPIPCLNHKTSCMRCREEIECIAGDYGLLHPEETVAEFEDHEDHY